VSEELEGSLREAIESYLGERLRVINEDLSRLQEEFNSTLARLREGSAAGSLADTPLARSIAEHLHTARTRGASDTAASEAAAAGADFADIKAAVADITGQNSQVNVLGGLVSQAAKFAQRAALFVIKNEQASGWRICGGSPGTISNDDLREMRLSLTTDTLLSYVARSRASWSGEPGSNSEDNLLLEELGGTPQRIAAVPLVVRGKTVAVLYVDTESSDPNAINVDALETLVLVAGTTVELLSVARAAKRVGETETTSPVAEAQARETEAAPLEQTPTPPALEAMPAAAPTFAEAPAEEISPAPEAEMISEEAAAPEIELPSVTPVAPTMFAPPAESVISSAPSFGSEYAAPLGTTRRWGIAEPDLPIEVDDDERRLHTDARRFARLLVSEIKLYNEQKVRDGRTQGDIYDRLREDIDRSRQMYEKRIAPPVAARYDYFHQELVNTLAGGDSSRLGASYPGASLAVH
jgi:hypothetical protein